MTTHEAFALGKTAGCIARTHCSWPEVSKGLAATDFLDSIRPNDAEVILLRAWCQGFDVACPEANRRLAKAEGGE